MSSNSTRKAEIFFFFKPANIFVQTHNDPLSVGHIHNIIRAVSSMTKFRHTGIFRTLAFVLLATYEVDSWGGGPMLPLMYDSRGKCYNHFHEI